MSFPIDEVRAQFPALSATDDGRRRIYFDAPGGTQACRQAIDRMAEHLSRGTANAGGSFASSVETDAMSAAAHEAVADLIGGDPGDVAFGPNMTSLTLAVSRALSRSWSKGDEIVLSRLDHDANVTPWVLAARDRDVAVRWIDFDPKTGRLDLEALPGLLNERTRLVAVGGASNALGTLNDIPAIARIVRASSSALLFVDAVQSVPHVVTDVKQLGCDFLVCSPYKFFGPHQGVLWGRPELMRTIEAYKVRPASDDPPAVRFETGTPSFEGQAGVLGTIDYLEWLGTRVAPARPNSRRAAIVAAMHACLDYEREIGDRLLAGLRAVSGLSLFGPPTMDERVPTFAFRIQGHDPHAIASALASNGINVWAGHFYAIEPLTRLGFIDKGGLVRVGLCHYSTAAEVDELIAALQQIASR